MHIVTEKLLNYYDRLIAPMPSPEVVRDFLNKPDIMAKWLEEEREWMITEWLKRNNWVEVTTVAPAAEVKAEAKQEPKPRPPMFPPVFGGKR